LKQVISGKNLKDKMIEAVTLLCDTVKSTLGPSGNNVIINESNLTPFITNDGVTIAQNITSDDEAISTILELTKEASIKTNETVGDGTTTTLVLLENIFLSGLKLVDEGYNPIKLKNDITNITNKIVSTLETLKLKTTDTFLYNIASVSSGSTEIGKLLSDAYLKTPNLKLLESKSNTSSYIIMPGYSFETIYASPYFNQKHQEISLNNAFIFLTTDYLDDINSIAPIINSVMDSNKSLVIIAEDYSDTLINELVLQNYEHKLNVVALKTPEYGLKKYDVLKDLSVLTNSLIFNRNLNILYENAKLSDLGKSKLVKINDSTTSIIGFNTNKLNLDKYIEELNQELLTTDDEFSKEYLQSRISKLQNGIGLIYVGAKTDLERKYLRMRYEDAICAINSSKNGILPGGGLAYLKVKSLITSDNLGEQLVLNALSSPLEQIILNAGQELSIIDNIESKNCDYLYNALTNKLESIKETEIMDSFDVIKNAIINASSIASMLLTTNFLVINLNEIQNLSIPKDEI
jgi:chaperonin GroEL